MTTRRDGAAWVLTIARPPANALDQATLSALAAALDAVATDDLARAVVLTSGVPGIFCAGGDLRSWRAHSDASFVSDSGRDVIRRLTTLPRLTVAMIDGHVVGDGLSLALACDLRIGSPRATFRLPEVALGFIPGWGAVRRLVDVVGASRASEMLLLGKTIDALEALRIGLVNEVVDEERLVERTMSIGNAAAELSPRALRAARCAILGGDERSCFASTWGSADWAEGIASVLAKRKPVFASTADEVCCG